MNATGQAPEHMQIFPVGGFNFRSLTAGPDTEPLALPGPQQAALPAPQSVQNAPVQAPRLSLPQRGAGLLSGLLNRSKRDAQNGAAANSQPPVTVTVEPPDDVQAPVQNGPQVQAQPAPAAASQPDPAAGLGIFEHKMLEAFMNADAPTQAALQEYAAQHSLAELVAYLQTQYPSYAGVFNEARVRTVMAAWQAMQAAQAPQAQMQNSAPKRAPGARRKPASGSKPASKSSASTKRGSNWQVILPLLDQANPGLTDADLAKVAGCSPSTVNRWRASRVAAQA